jgi:hypothetical protein
MPPRLSHLPRPIHLLGLTVSTAPKCDSLKIGVWRPWSGHKKMFYPGIVRGSSAFCAHHTHWMFHLHPRNVHKLIGSLICSPECEKTSCVGSLAMALLCTSIVQRCWIDTSVYSHLVLETLCHGLDCGPAMTTWSSVPGPSKLSMKLFFNVLDMTWQQLIRILKLKTLVSALDLVLNKDIRPYLFASLTAFWDYCW